MHQQDERYLRLMQLLEGDIARVLEGHSGRIRGYDSVDLDLGRGVVVFAKGNKTLWSGRTELIGSFLRDVCIWRWWWEGSDRPVTRSPLNSVYAAGQSHGVKTLTSAQPMVRDDREAVLLANVSAALAKADGIHLALTGDRMTFYALYATGDHPRAPVNRTTTDHHHDSLLPAHEPMPPVSMAREAIMSVPPLEVGPLRGVRPSQRPVESLAAASPVIAAYLEVREPERRLVMPLVRLALASVVTYMPAGFQQALITLDLQVQEGVKARFYVVVVATDIEGNISAVPTPQGLMEAARELIEEDARQGNGRWRRLCARLKNKPTGISVRVGVHA